MRKGNNFVLQEPIEPYKLLSVTYINHKKVTEKKIYTTEKVLTK